MPRNRLGKRLTQLKDARAVKKVKISQENHPPEPDRVAPPNPPGNDSISRTAKKLEMMKINEDDVAATEQKWFLVHTDQLNELLKGTVPFKYF